MKTHLFDDLNILDEEVKAAAAGVTNIYNSINNYKSIRTICWEEKARYIKQWKCTHYKTTHHSRQEEVFDSIKFNDDLALANANLQSKQQKLNQVKLEIQSEISSARSIINEYNLLQSTNKELENQISTIKNNNGISYVRNTSANNLTDINKNTSSQQKVAVIQKYIHQLKPLVGDKDGKTAIDYAKEYCPEAIEYINSSFQDVTTLNTNTTLNIDIMLTTNNIDDLVPTGDQQASIEEEGGV